MNTLDNWQNVSLPKKQATVTLMHDDIRRDNGRGRVSQGRYGVGVGVGELPAVVPSVTLYTAPPTHTRERNVLFNDALNTFYLRLYGVRHMVEDHSDSEKGNPLPPHRLLLSINSKGYLICTIPQRG